MKKVIMPTAGVFVLLSAAINGAYAGAIAAQQKCSVFVNRNVEAKSFDEIAGFYKNAQPKGEFETTASYQQRMESAGHVQFVVSKKIESTEYIKYDADNQVLNVQSYAFHNTNFDAWSAFYYAKSEGLSASTSENIDVVISEVDNRSGSYVGQNAFGAKANISKITRTTKAIFQRSAAFGENLFLYTGDNGIIGKLAVRPEDAKRLKNSLRIAFVIRPVPPYLVKAKFPFGEATVSSPLEINVDATVLVAKIQCGLLLDGGGKVLDAYDAQGLR